MNKHMMKRFVCITLLSLSSMAQAEDAAQSLLDIYQLALKNDAALASATYENKAAQELVEQAKSLYRPNVNFNATVSASQTDIRFLSGNNPFRSDGRSSFEGYNYGVEARQPIYRKDSLIQIDQSRLQVSQADKNFALAQQNLIVRSTQAYFDVLLAQDKIDLINAQKTAIQGQLDQAKANFDVGTATITDVNEAQARYDLVLAQEIATLNQLQVAKHTLETITGNNIGQLASVRADLATNTLKHSMNQWIDATQQNNLNIQIQQEAVKLAEQEVKRASAGHQPTLDAVASYTDNYTNGSANGFGSELKNGTVSLQLQVPIYQGGAISSRERQTALNLQKAIDDLDLSRRQATLETQRAYLNLSSSIAQVKAFEQALKSSQTQLDSTKLGYEVGVRTSVDVLNAQQQLFSAKRDLLEARYNYLVNIIKLKSATGIVTEADLADINQQLVVARHGK